MSVPIPQYLQDISSIEKNKKNWVQFSIKCTCGCAKFFVYENTENAVIKIKCNECGAERVIFDERYHGYNAVASEDRSGAVERQDNFALVCDDAVAVQVKVENDATLDEFNENTGLDFSEDQYANAFSWITIYKLNDKGKATIIFDEETA